MSPGQGCFYPQGTPAGANSATGNDIFWSCDGGLLVIDPTAVKPNTLSTIGYVQSAAGVVLKLGYCSPGSIASGPDLALANTVPGAPPYVGDFANVLLGCSPRFNGNTAGTGSAVNIAENYSLDLNVKSSPFGLPGPFPAVDPVSPFNQTVAGINPNNSATPLTPGCSARNIETPSTEPSALSAVASADAISVEITETVTIVVPGQNSEDEEAPAVPAGIAGTEPSGNPLASWRAALG